LSPQTAAESRPASTSRETFRLELGAVLRCPTCADVTLRVTLTPHGCFVDMRGAEVVHFA
jgi:hypothetical protein